MEQVRKNIPDTEPLFLKVNRDGQYKPLAERTARQNIYDYIEAMTGRTDVSPPRPAPQRRLPLGVHGEGEYEGNTDDPGPYQHRYNRAVRLPGLPGLGPRPGGQPGHEPDVWGYG